MQPWFRESRIPEKMQIVFRRCNMQVMINDDHTCLVQTETYYMHFRKIICCVFRQSNMQTMFRENDLIVEIEQRTCRLLIDKVTYMYMQTVIYVL